MPSFVLCTAYDQYAVEAFRLEVLDYLLKPVDRERLSLTVERARRQMLDPEPAARRRPACRRATRSWSGPAGAT